MGVTVMRIRAVSFLDQCNNAIPSSSGCNMHSRNNGELENTPIVAAIEAVEQASQCQVGVEVRINRWGWGWI